MELRDLQKMTVVKLREEAMKHSGLVGVNAMSKNELIGALAPIFGIDLEALSRTTWTRFSTNKTTLKQEIRQLKSERDATESTPDSTSRRTMRQGIKRRKRTLRHLASRAKAAAKL
jgi:predicted ATP-dependent endonuclease of OLD family